ncbi:MAG: hypothetical protein SFZ23_06410 [Planctomycetota bacterium]|nr:hypothetical protein [Planctomycetota bacterium]
MLVVTVVVLGGIGAWLYATSSSASRTAAQDARAAAEANTPTIDARALDALLDAAGKYAQGGEFSKAEAILSQAIASAPDNQRLRLAFAEVLLAAKRPAESYDEYVAALSIGPRDAETEFRAGTVANMIDRPDRSVEHYLAAQRADPKNPQVPLFLAQVQTKLGQLEEAKANLVIAATMTPEKAVVWGSLAEIALRQNVTSMAAQHIAKARELEPESAVWRLLEARVLKRDGNAIAALQLLAGLDEQTRAQKPILAIMAECYGMLRRPSDAASLYVNAADEQVNDAELAFQAALWLERAGDTKGAIDYARRAEMAGHSDAGKVVARLSDAAESRSREP